MNGLKLFGRFLISRQFLLHLGVAILTVILLTWITQKMLEVYTHHGADNNITVPNLVGVHLDDLDAHLADKGLEYEIVDSVYSDKAARGTVYNQHPRPTDSTGQFVKEGRTIYLTVVAKAPKMILVPWVVDKSKRHAEGILKIVGLKVKYTYKPSSSCKDCVLAQKHKGKAIAKEIPFKVEKGETIELILGQGRGSGTENVPNLIGKTIDQANSSLGSVSLSLFVGSCEGCTTRKDSLSAVIYKQSPAGGSEAETGSDITVWLNTDPAKAVKTNEPEN
ncbi:MAG: PASTA domain-containing protein [Bacteroidota bacterium]